MGSVTDITISGDNDEPIYPVRYKMHYMYCDHCGSFNLKSWMEPKNYLRLQRLKKYLERLSIFAFIIGLALILMKDDLFVFILAFFLILFLGIIFIISRTIKNKGIYCEDCESTYENGSSFFVSLEENPRNYKMGDVPLPLYKTYRITGEILGPAKETGK